MPKTIAVATIRDKINRMLAVPLKTLPTEQKQVLCSLAEEVLMETKNYRGFQFINVPAERAANLGPDDAEYYNRRYF
jgi:hypothetical protein